MKKASDRDEIPNLRGTQTLQRGLDIIDHLANGPVRLADLATALSLPRSTAYRLARALHAREYLASTRDGYAIGPRLRNFQAPAQQGADGGTAVAPYLKR